MKKAAIIMAGGLLCSSLTMAAEKADWDKVLEQAKQEGNVTFHVWYLQSQWRIFVQEFEKQYGIKVRIPEGRLDGNVNKLLAEAGKKKGRLDVIAMSVTQLPVMMGLKALAKIDDLPGYDDAVHQIQNVDTQGYAVAFWVIRPVLPMIRNRLAIRHCRRHWINYKALLTQIQRGSAITTQITVARGKLLSRESSPLRAVILTAKRTALTQR